MCDLIRKSDAQAVVLLGGSPVGMSNRIAALPAVTVGVETCSRCCGYCMTIGDGGDPRICPKCKGDGVEPVPEPDHDVVEIDLRAAMMEQIEEAASQSPWVPPEYMMNEIISDCCTFLREARAPDTAAIREAALHVENAKRLRRYDWQEWTAQDIEDAEGIICAFLALIQKGTTDDRA